MSRPILVSSCLLGLLTRYDGATKRNQAVLDYLRREDLVPIPICPEQLAGLPTPRPATRFAKGCGTDVVAGTGRVVNALGETVNDIFLRGGRESLKIVKLTGCGEALLKERSPSCGVHQVYLGETLVEGCGVTTAILKEAGIEVFSEEDI